MLALTPPPYTLWALMAWLGVAYALWPPQVWRWPMGVAAGVLAWAMAQTVLPHIGHPAWLNTTQAAGLPDPKTISVGAAVSWLQIFPAMGGFLACVWFVGQRYGQREIKPLLRELGIVLGVLSAIAAVCLMGGWTHPSYEKIGFFSYFANRNQSATLYALTTVVALGLFMFEHKWRWKSVGAIVMAVGLVALSSNPSRGGWVSLAVGSLVVLWHTRHRWAYISLGAVAMALIVLVLAPQAVTRQATSTKSVRLSYAHSALEMAQDNPLGVGLGNFRYIFGHYQKITPPDTIAVHPENDWLWWLSELGWPALLILVAVGGLRLDTKERRAPIVIGALAAIAVPSLFDVPLHRLWMVMAMLTLASPLLKPNNAVRMPAWRAWAIVPLVLGWVSYRYINSFGAEIALHKRAIYNYRSDLIEQTFQRAVKLMPYDFVLYQNMAQHYLYEGNDPAKASDYTYKALAAHPKFPLMPKQLSGDWEEVNPTRSFTLLREGMRRSDKEDRPAMMQTNVLMRMGPNDYGKVAQMCERDPRLWEIFLTQQKAIGYLGDAVKRGIDPTRLKGAKEILQRWSSDKRYAQEALDYLHTNHPDSIYIAHAYAALGEYDAAVEHYFATQPLSPIKDVFDYLSLDELRLQLRLKHPPQSDPYALALLARAMEVNDEATMREIGARLLAQDNPPTAIVQHKAQEYATAGRTKAAWELLKQLH